MKERKFCSWDGRVGIYYILTTWPIWTTAAVLAAISLTVLVGRDILEGLMYNVSYSSMVGDAALIICVLIAATILQRNRDCCCVPYWLQNYGMQRDLLILSFLIGLLTCWLTLGSRSGQVMDIYHDLAIGPLFLFFAITLLPVIFKNGNGKEVFATILLIALWAGLVVFDIKYDRLNQRQWLKDHHGIFQTYQAQEEPENPINFMIMTI